MKLVFPVVSRPEHGQSSVMKGEFATLDLQRRLLMNRLITSRVRCPDN